MMICPSSLSKQTLSIGATAVAIGFGEVVELGLVDGFCCVGSALFSICY
jgi:hypothetical protein